MVKRLKIIADHSALAEQFTKLIRKSEYGGINIISDFDDFISNAGKDQYEITIIFIETNNLFIKSILNYLKSGINTSTYLICVMNRNSEVISEISEHIAYFILYDPLTQEQITYLINTTLDKLSKMTTQLKLKTIKDDRYLSMNQSTVSIGPDARKYAFFKSGTEIVKVFFSDIIYVQSDHVYVFLHTSAKKIALRAKLEDIESYLPAHLFQRIHQRYIINMEQIIKVNNDSVFLNELELPLAKKYKKDMFDRLMFL